MIGSVVTATQAGYALGLIFLVPLGDGINRKTLTITLLSLSATALLAAGLAPNFVTLLCALFFIGLLAVVPEAQGQSIGQRLMLAAADWGRARQLERLRVATQISNLTAMRLYLRSGARLESTAYWFYRRGHDSL